MKCPQTAKASPRVYQDAITHDCILIHLQIGLGYLRTFIMKYDYLYIKKIILNLFRHSSKETFENVHPFQ